MPKKKTHGQQYSVAEDLFIALFGNLPNIKSQDTYIQK